jgi:hypothetical protein
VKEAWRLIGAVALLAVAKLVLLMCGRASVSGTPAPASSPTVTLADEGRTITLGIGDSFLLELGEDCDWTPTVGDQTVVSRAEGITVIQGAQGVYLALKAGKTTLTATGDPVCQESSPPCERLSRGFAVQTVVQ